MKPVERHPFEPDVRFDGGSLDCGSGLLLLIRKAIDPLERGGLLEILSTESSVKEDLPSWCRMTGNELVSWTRSGTRCSFLICKGALRERTTITPASSGLPGVPSQTAVPVRIPETLPEPANVPEVPPLSITGIGSWPRPSWLLRAIHEHLEGRLPEAEFQSQADDAVRLSIAAQLRAGVDIVTDGEQRRDSYASFVGGLLDNCQLIPLTDLLPLVDDPGKFEKELRALDVPAGEVRHPAVFGPLGRSRPLAVHELEFVKTLSDKAVKVALPGPYLLTRTMWLECVSDRAYDSRESLADDIVRVLREELHFLLAAGASIVQFDEPVLTEVVFTGAKKTRSFMCGALSGKKDARHELSFAVDLLNRVVKGVPSSRTAVHICRGNWTTDESVALSGDYRPLLPYLKSAKAGTFFLELCTPRSGEIEVLKGLPEECRIGVGVVNQKASRVETVDEIVAKAEKAIRIFGHRRILLNPDCGFATFADNPVSESKVAEAKLRSISLAAGELKRKYRLS
ncbi:MAG: sulfurtransferase TusA family protein [Deltaproteobacteria bacterium]|nr:sulfurtransferase TusA family protein [Deltaproteobacteria bacterium]